MGKVKKSAKKPQKIKRSDMLGHMMNAAQAFVEDCLNYSQDDVIEWGERDIEFGEWITDQPDFLKIPSGSEYEDMPGDAILRNMRMHGLGLAITYFGIVTYDDIESRIRLKDEEWSEDSNHYTDSFFEDDDWNKALNDLSESENYDFWITLNGKEFEDEEEEEEEEEEITLNEAIAKTAIADMAAKVEKDEETPEADSAGIAEVNSELPTIPEDCEASVDNFIEDLNAENEVFSHPVPSELPDIATTSDAVPWAILAAVAKHKKAIDENDSPVKALANGVEELVDEGSIVTKRGLLDTLLILIEAEPADAMRIIACWEMLN